MTRSDMGVSFKNFEYTENKAKQTTRIHFSAASYEANHGTVIQHGSTGAVLIAVTTKIRLVYWSQSENSMCVCFSHHRS